MAVETVAELYYQLGLDTAKLDKGFIDAQKTVNQNMRIMNRQEALIKLRADVQIQGLGENIKLSDAFKIRQEELAQQLDISRNKVELTSAAYEQMAQSQGENAEASQLLAIQLEKERLVMAQLERQTRELNEQQNIAIGVQWELLGLIEPALKGIRGLATEYNYTFGRFSTLQVQVGTAIAMTLAAFALGTKQASDELEQENLAKLLDNEFAQAQINISNSLDTINQQALQTSRRMNQAFQYGAQREITNEDYVSDFLRLESILTDESNSLSQTLKNVASQTNYMNTEFGKTIGLTIGVVKSFMALKESTKNWAAPALEGFRNLQIKAQEMKVPLPVAEDILNAITLAQGNYDDVRDWVRGVQDAIIKGDVFDPESLALEKYNVAIQDARGNLLPFNEALENLYQGFLKAKDAGEEEAYIIMTNGQSVHDVLPFLENFGEALKKLNDIKWSTSDYDSLNQLSQNMLLTEMQAKEFKNALSSLAIPLANYSTEDDFKFFKTLTQIIEENRDTVLYWEFAFIEALKKVESLAGDAIDLIIEKFNELKDSETLDTVMDFIKTLTSPAQMVLDVPLNFINSFIDSDSSSEILEQAKKDLDDYNAANEKARAETQKTAKEITDGLSYSWNRIRQYKDEMADIQIELKFGDNEYEKELAKLDQWRDEVLRNAKYYREEQDAIEKLYWVKRQQIVEKHLDEIERIEREKAERIAEIRRQVNSNFQTDLQNKFEDIDINKKNWISDGMEKAEAEVLAQKLKAKTITDLNKEFAESLDSIWQNSLERRLAGIEREKQAWIQKGIDEVKATQWAERAKVDAQREAALQVLRSQAEELQAFKEDGYEGLKQLKLDKLFDAGISPEDLMMTPKQLADFQKAQQMAEKSLLPNFMTSQEQDLEKRWLDYSLYQEQMKLREHHENPNFPTKLIYDGKDLTEQGLQEYFGLIPKEELSKLPQSVEQVENSFSGVSNAAENLEQKLIELQESFLQGGENPQLTSKFDFRDTEAFSDNLINNFEDFNSIIENLSSTFENFAPIIENLGSYFDEFTSQIITVTENFSELIDTLSNTDTALKNNQNSQQQPTNITNNVSINEAHAWDYSHIQELAEKVADVITPKILSALGGDSNSY